MKFGIFDPLGGQVVEIIKSKNEKGPSAKWLDFVATRQAVGEINRYLRKKEQTE